MGRRSRTNTPPLSPHAHRLAPPPASPGSTNTKQKRCWEASQEVPRLLWIPTIYYRVHETSPFVPILSQINSVHTASYFMKIHFSIILPLAPRSSKCSPSLRFPHQNHVCISSLPCTCHMPRLSHSSWFVHSNNIWWENRSYLSITQSARFFTGRNTPMETKRYLILLDNLDLH